MVQNKEVGLSDCSHGQPLRSSSGYKCSLSGNSVLQLLSEIILHQLHQEPCGFSIKDAGFFRFRRLRMERAWFETRMTKTRPRAGMPSSNILTGFFQSPPRTPCSPVGFHAERLREWSVRLFADMSKAPIRPDFTRICLAHG